MKFISTVFQIYQRFLIYIGGFQNISAILNLYRRFFKYIDLPTKIDNAKDPLIRKWVLSNHLFSENRRSCVNPGSKFISPLCRTYTVLFPSNFGGFRIIRQPLVRSFYIILHILRCTDNYVLLSSAVTLGAICAIFELLINNFYFLITFVIISCHHYIATICFHL